MARVDCLVTGYFAAKVRLQSKPDIADLMPKEGSVVGMEADMVVFERVTNWVLSGEEMHN